MIPQISQQATNPENLVHYRTLSVPLSLLDFQGQKVICVTPILHLSTKLGGLLFSEWKWRTSGSEEEERWGD